MSGESTHPDIDTNKDDLKSKPTEELQYNTRTISPKEIQILEAPLRNDPPPPDNRYYDNYGQPTGYYQNYPQDPRYQQQRYQQPPPQIIIINNSPDPRGRRAYGGGRGRQPYYDDSSEIMVVNEGPPINLFTTIEIRNKFIRKVYTILAIQLFFSFGFICLAVFEPNVRRGIQNASLVILIVAMIIYLIAGISLFCCGDLRRQVPVNFILLSVMTVALTLMMAVISVNLNTMAVVYAMLTTALVCFLVSVFAIQTRWDVTGCGMFLCIGMLVLMIFGLIISIMALCHVYIKALHIVFSALATLLFCFYLMYDTQQIMGGRRHEISPEEYIHGAIALYIDIMYIFMHIASLFGLCMSDS